MVETDRAKLAKAREEHAGALCALGYRHNKPAQAIGLLVQDQEQDGDLVPVCNDCAQWVKSEEMGKQRVLGLSARP